MRRLAPVVLATVCSAALSSCGPRMKRQVSIRPFKREMPPMPENTVPRGGTAPVPSVAAARGLRSPVAESAARLADGGRYYGYYCAMCHGDDGRGRTPLGDSYNPRPVDLTGPRVRGMSEGEVYRAMLVGPGHEPVLSTTVAPDRRWPIVTYVRHLAAQSGGGGG